MTNRLSDTIRNTFPQKRIVIVGDLVADQFLNGTIARVSREAPVFILRHDETHTLAGGAANAAVNVASLGGKTTLIGLAGLDANGRLLLDRLESEGVDCSSVIAEPNLRTTTKIRVLAGQQHAARQQVIRIDYENSTEINAPLRERLVSNFEQACKDADAIIISDYDYGVADTGIFELAKKLAAERSIPLLIDSRFRLRDFKGATSATPNQDEVEQLVGQVFAVEKCEKLREELGFESLLVTRGNKGMLLLQNGRPPEQYDAVGLSEPVDVTGAGDTVIAVFALSLASGLSYSDAALVANHAGGIVVMKKGTASITPSELAASLGNQVSSRMSESAP